MHLLVGHKTATQLKLHDKRATESELPPKHTICSTAAAAYIGGYCRPPGCPYLVVTVHAVLVCIQASWAGVAGVVNKHPVHALVLVVEVAHLSAHDVDAQLCYDAVVVGGGGEAQTVMREGAGDSRTKETETDGWGT